MISPWSHSRLELNRPVAPKDWGPPSPRVPKFVSPAHALSPKSAWSSPASSYLRRKWLFFKMQIPPFFGECCKEKYVGPKKCSNMGRCAQTFAKIHFPIKALASAILSCRSGRRRSVNHFFSYVLSHGLREGHIWCSSIQTLFMYMLVHVNENISW